MKPKICSHLFHRIIYMLSSFLSRLSSVKSNRKAFGQHTQTGISTQVSPIVCPYHSANEWKYVLCTPLNLSAQEHIYIPFVEFSNSIAEQLRLLFAHFPCPSFPRFSTLVYTWNRFQKNAIWFTVQLCVNIVHTHTHRGKRGGKRRPNMFSVFQGNIAKIIV